MTICGQIEDALEEKCSAHLKEVIRDSVHPKDAGITPAGFGEEQAATTFSVSLRSVYFRTFPIFCRM